MAERLPLNFEVGFCLEQVFKVILFLVELFANVFTTDLRQFQDVSVSV